MLGELIPPSCIFIQRRAAPQAAGAMADAVLEDRDAGEDAREDDVREAAGTKFAGACPTRTCPTGRSPAGRGALDALAGCFRVAPGVAALDADGGVAALDAAGGMGLGVGTGAPPPFDVVAVGNAQAPLHPPGGTGAAPPVMPCHGAPPVMSCHGEAGCFAYGGGGGGTIVPTLPRGVLGFAADAARSILRFSMSAMSSASLMSAAAITRNAKEAEQRREKG